MSEDDNGDLNPFSKRNKENIGGALNTLANVTANYLSFGLVGFEEGKLKGGVTTRALDETIGEVTGRNAARQAQSEAREQLKEEKAIRNQQIKDEQERRKNTDISASQATAAYRASTSAQFKGSLGASADSPSRDFLGL